MFMNRSASFMNSRKLFNIAFSGIRNRNWVYQPKTCKSLSNNIANVVQDSLNLVRKLIIGMSFCHFLGATTWSGKPRRIRGRTGCKVSIPMSERWVRSNLEHVGAKNHDVIIWNFVENEVFFHHTRTSYYSCVCFVQLLQARIAQEEAWNSSRAKVKRGWCMETILLQISLQFIACHCSLCSFQLISWLS